MNDQPTTLELIPVKRGKKYIVTAKTAGEVIHLDTLDPSSERQRSKFARAVNKKCEAFSVEQIDAELLKIVSRDGGEPTPANTPPTGGATRDFPPEVLAEAEVVLADPLLINRVCDDVASLGVAGERELALTVYLIGVSRLLPKPLSGIVRGSSSSGKSFLIERVATLFPPEP